MAGRVSQLLVCFSKKQIQNPKGCCWGCHHCVRAWLPQLASAGWRGQTPPGSLGHTIWCAARHSPFSEPLCPWPGFKGWDVG